MKKIIVYDISLSDFLDKSTFAEAARLLKLTKDAVRQMISNEREIYLRFTGDGFAEYCEFKTYRDGTMRKTGPSMEWIRAKQKAKESKKLGRRATKKKARGRAA